MTPLARLLLRIGWKNAELARRIGRSADTVDGWASGKLNARGKPTPTPPAVLAWLERVARAVELRPWDG